MNPVVLIISGPTLKKISEQALKGTTEIQFMVSLGEGATVFTDYTVRVVESVDAIHTDGVQIPTTAGSVNMSATGGSFDPNEPITCSIKGTDLEAASAGDGDKIIRIYVKDDLGNWST